MLVLDRKVGERILAGDMEVQVLRIGRGRVKLGLTAPKAVTILRPEAKREHPGSR